MKKSRFTEEQIIGFLKQAEAGVPRSGATSFPSPPFDAIEARLRTQPGWVVNRWDASHD